VSLLELLVSTWFISHIVSQFWPLFSSSGQHVDGEIAAILGARVGGMTSKRVKAAARMLETALTYTLQRVHW